MSELFILRSDALAAVERMQRRGFITRLEYASTPGGWEVWSCGWLVSWKSTADLDHPGDA